MSASDISQQIQASFEGLESPVILFVVNPIHYQDVMVRLIKYLTETFTKGIYISLNKPYNTLKKIFAKEGVDISRLFFLDSVTYTPEREEPDCMFLGKTSELSEICISVNRAVEKHKDSKFIILDSLSTLLIYNDAKSVARFAHLISENLRRWGLTGAVVCVELATESDVIAQAVQFCDTVLKMG